MLLITGEVLTLEAPLSPDLLDLTVVAFEDLLICFIIFPLFIHASLSNCHILILPCLPVLQSDQRSAVRMSSSYAQETLRERIKWEEDQIPSCLQYIHFCIMYLKYC